MTNDRIKIYFDTEFTGLHQNTTLISIGLVSESGAYFYAEFTDYDGSQVDDWILDHVIKNRIFNEVDHYEYIKEVWYDSPVDGNPHRHFNIYIKDSTQKISSNLLFWLKWESDSYMGRKVQFHSDCCAYDWVLLNDLICKDGNALNLPDYLDYIPIDLSTVLHMEDIDPDINREELVGDLFVRAMHERPPFNKLIEYKHNSLWDAYIISECFMRIYAKKQQEENKLREILEIAGSIANKKEEEEE